MAPLLCSAMARHGCCNFAVTSCRSNLCPPPEFCMAAAREYTLDRKQFGAPLAWYVTRGTVRAV